MRKMLIALSFVFSITTAEAQDIAPAFDMTLMAGWSGQGAAVEQMKRETGVRLAQRPSARVRSHVASRVNFAQVVAKTNYRPDVAVRNRVYSRAVAMLQKANPAQAGQFRQLLVSGKMRNEVAAYLARNGMSANNLVDTTTLYLAVAWLTANGSAGEPTPAQLKGLRKQVGEIYAAMPSVLDADNVMKQELAEVNILQTSMSSAAAEQAAGSPRAAASTRAAIVRGVKASYQLDLSRMNLTAQGLR